MFYLKIAWSNIRKSFKSFAPFILASLILYALNASLWLILTSPMAQDMGTGSMTLVLGLVVLTVFSLIMEIYSYQVLLKQRSREFGLYNVLGMKKRQVGLIASLELGLIFLFLISLGSLFSAIFSQFLYLVFVNIVNYDQLIMSITPLAFGLNSLVFAGIFLVLNLIGLRFIGKTSPLILFRQQEQGEKEPRGNAILAFLGLASLLAGYYYALTSGQLAALGVLFRFFWAVLLVMAGTYLFYISFTTWYLKKRRQNKAYFYQPEHFISTSQMIFRMKQNATGLASITLLATMAFVTISTTLALYTNTQNLVNQTFYRNTVISYNPEDSSIYPAEDFYTDVLAKVGKSREEALTYQSSLIGINVKREGKIVINQDNLPQADPTEVGFVYVMGQETYRSLGNDLPELTAGQAAFANPRQEKNKVTDIQLFDQHFQIVSHPTNPKVPDLASTYNSYVLIVETAELAREVVASFEPYMTKITSLPETYTIQLDLTEEEQAKLGHNELDQIPVKTGYATVRSKQQYLNEAYGFFGGLLFTGFLLGFSFLLGIAIIIYYKQYSEGQEDKKAYKILQEVGMGAAAVKKTIHAQIILVFFMPLILASSHFLAALPMLKQMLQFFGVSSTGLVYLVSGVCLLLISILYFAIYRLTSRSYYKIVAR